MGTIGGVEKVMVFGILLIILTILGVAVYSAAKVDNDLTPSPFKSAGKDRVDDPMVAILDGSPSLDGGAQASRAGRSKPFLKDILPAPAAAGQEALKVNANLKETPTNAVQEPPHESAATSMEVQGAQSEASPAAMNPTAAPATRQAKEAKTEAMQEYVVRKGDSFTSIARAVYGEERLFKKLMEANPDIDPQNLQIGQKIKLPPKEEMTRGVAQKEAPPDNNPGGKTYVVKPGDTLVQISKKLYGTAGRWMDLYNANRDIISDPDYVPAGVCLRVP